ncbi:3-deoxy-7-phosphoheptulonate synthase [Enterovibrio norvegicus]|uniref:3-deoxy-D-arabinoheptulosonate-7-phosphate synthase n=1 Tax=Enterovibrio norvegicus DSM 15893 TaxID=1121869 RepID=A0A1I5WM88_9GAMM|nr:3-deoxy-7-phosphoheptulonate synthase [Enterovibrio norvegicus]SFQ20904.1 3-deoxy-D-arabinoheptulosonate-7-phosphate synthase [Enterovibrio norvegicus DSM 15893]
MIIVLKPHATERQAKVILGKIEQAGLKPLFMPGVERIVLGALGDERVLQKLHIESDPLVEEVKPILSKYKMVSREVQAHNTVVRIGNMSIGGGKFAVIAGPCSVESEQQLLSVAEVVKSHGAAALRGGAYKPRTSPYDFQGMGVEGLKLLKQASDATGMPTVSEVMEVSQVDSLCEYIDCLQIGARNMQNYGLLKAVGETGKPVLLKRGLSATIEELLLAAEYIYDAGNPNIILCERGIRTYETATRNTLDLNAVAYIKQRSHLPVVVDPSHGTGVRELVIPLSRAAAAVGADGIIVESHLNPAEALSDGHQALTGDMFAQLMQELKPFVEAAGRTL